MGMCDRDPTEAAVTDALNELEAEGKVESEFSEDDEEPTYSLTGEGEAYVEQQIQTDAETQLSMLQLHWNVKCAEKDTTVEQLRTLFDFVADVRDDHGVNLLRTLEAHRDVIEPDPIPDLSEPTLRRYDP